MKYKRKNLPVTILTYDEIKEYWKENRKLNVFKFEIEGITITVNRYGEFFVEEEEIDEVIHWDQGIIKEDDEWPCVVSLEYIVNNYEILEEELI